jgi:hypothetical protein
MGLESDTIANLGKFNGLVAFVDILGYKEKTDRDDGEELYNFFNSISDVMSDGSIDEIEMGSKENPNKFIRHFSPYVSFFSDSLLMIYPWDKGTIKLRSSDVAITSGLYHSTQFIEKIQYNALLNLKLLSRGAIVIDDVFMKKTTSGNRNQVILGKALNRAVEYEKNIAIYPRVLCGPDVNVWLEVKSTHGYTSYNRDFDGYYYINFLRHAFFSQDRKGDMSSIRETIIKNMDDTIKNAKHYSKWQWMANYYNNFIDSAYCKDFLLIEIEKIPVL